LKKPIQISKATKIALDITRVDKIAIENSKAGKVTAVVTIMIIYGKNMAINGVLTSENC
jgi:hypothetical protein